MTHTESHFENEPTARFEIDPCTRPLNPHLTHLVKLERSKTLLIRFCFQYLEPSCAPTIRVRNPGSSHSLRTAAAQAGETVFADRAIRVNALCRGESLRSFFLPGFLWSLHLIDCPLFQGSAALSTADGRTCEGPSSAASTDRV